MDSTPSTQYATIGDADIAYQVVGSGPLDVLYVYGLGSHVESWRELPAADQFLRRLASFGRVTFFDRRGTGSSEAVARDAVPTWEEWAEDLGAVLDAVGSERTAIVASLDAGPIAILYAAMHPERVSALVLVNTGARFLAADDYPIGLTSESLDGFVELVREEWGQLSLVALTSPSIADDPEYMEVIAKVMRMAATPRAAAAQLDSMMRSLDVRSALPMIQALTLVLHVHDSPIAPIELGRYLAEHIEGSTFVELPGSDLGATPSIALIADEVEEFLTGERPVVEVERVLTTMLFTDIVGSTERAAAMGDARWVSLLDAHDKAVRGELHRLRGREIDTAGDGFFASFDGPARAIRCAQAIIEATGRLGLELRAGLHTGECEVRGERLGGLAVHIAARIGAKAGASEVLVSRTVKDLVVGSSINFAERGEHDLKGVPGTWTLFAVT